MSTRNLIDALLHDRAVRYAKDVMYWRRAAALCGPSTGQLTLRRRYLRLARQSEARVLDAAICAENCCRIEARQ